MSDFYERMKLSIARSPITAKMVIFAIAKSQHETLKLGYSKLG
ncbi:hypothetical protein [Roseofilum casamattae]|uniref:Uncharacterized protein n=1 Tax=Roseofilum casamattae BLCC-M143 TaxID=3022442 RepID=A0ABT7C142_9CYAN|nr:hypothetical protein [Roseofilum casamattae]MDJ1185174.1 hypothetical protein [Roseofilum casamattae BLCC-M143]